MKELLEEQPMDDSVPMEIDDSDDVEPMEIDEPMCACQQLNWWYFIFATTK